ncbi:flagellar export chaperone FliS [Vallicoccus soli]|uniref:Flagellar export chaperone FliS n=1 Tax=Vallicoccus soli TaxID=2339232 RepID=A0A3A3YRE8_9ACTN|nr:flagellar export chaperone FliS [Vallicoccus soli]RJK92822.1 flagellar export chaperone FliS [Vallicoccus soli]
MSAAAYSAYRARFVEDSLATASPARLLTMLYDRLLLDVDRAEAAQQRGDRVEAGRQLLHAQEIVLELRSSLKVDLWEGGPGLSALYGFLHSELVRANVTGDPGVTAGCRGIVAPLRDAWHEAARTAPQA